MIHGGEEPVVVMGSQIAQNEEDQTLLGSWVKEAVKNNFYFKLLYRGSRDGFGAADFHAKCDAIEHTVTIIKTSDGHVCGGYAKEAWRSTKEDAPLVDPKAFVFSLSRHVKCAEQSNMNSVCHNALRGPTFGYEEAYGYDIAVADRCDKESSVFAGNNTYKLPADSDSDFFTGSEGYNVAEIEVHQCIIQS